MPQMQPTEAGDAAKAADAGHGPVLPPDPWTPTGNVATKTFTVGQKIGVAAVVMGVEAGESPHVIVQIQVPGYKPAKFSCPSSVLSQIVTQ